MEIDVNYSLPGLFFERADRLGDKPFMWRKIDGVYQSQSYAEVADDVSRISRGLRALGIQAGDRVMLVSENRPEWIIADLAIMAAGAITVPAYTTNTTDDHLFILENSGAKLAIASGERLARRLLPAARSADDCNAVLLMEQPDHDTQAGVSVLGWDEISRRGGETPDDAREFAHALDREATCCFIYTSGTGGRPKGVMLTHKSILANCMGAHDLLAELGLGDEVFLSILPLSHSFEHTCGMAFPIALGAEIYFAEGPDTIAQNLAEVRPTITVAVPRLYEVMYERIRRGVERTGGLSAKLFNRTVELGIKHDEDPTSLTLMERLQNAALDRLVRRKVAMRFGGRLKAFVSGGAALNPDIGKFFLALGTTLLQGYGQTEASPVISCNRLGKIKIHTVGPPLKGVEVKIAEDGEILVRGDLLMQGYWHDPATTAEVLKDGWLYTGDVGRIDDDGYIEITDRKKEIIVNSGGDNIAPARIEGELTVTSEIAQAMVYGDKRPYLVAVIVPEHAFVVEWARANGKQPELASLAEDADFRRVMSEVMDGVNANLSLIEKVRRFVLAEEAFTTDNAMMTPTLKVRRHKVREAYWERLDALYGRS